MHPKYRRRQPYLGIGIANTVHLATEVRAETHRSSQPFDIDL